MKICGCSPSLFFAIFSIIVARSLFFMNAFKKVSKDTQAAFQKNPKSCHSLAGTDKFAPSCEDFRFISDDIIVGGYGSIFEYVDHGSKSRSVSTLFAVDLSTERYRELELKNFPVGRELRPHGMEFNQGRLYVVNHAENMTERLEIFDVKGETNLNSVTLTWVKSIEPPVPKGALNSVAAVSHNEVYVTHWLPFSLPFEGLEHPKGAETASALGNLAYLTALKMLHLPQHAAGLTSIYRCTIDDGRCTKAYGNFVSANGIEVSADGKLVFVADCLRSTLSVFDRNTSTGKLTLKIVQELPHDVDNIMIGPQQPSKDGKVELWLGTMPDFIKYVANAHPIPGGLLVATYDPSTNQVKVEDAFIHDGSVVSGVATAAKWKGKVLLSGPKKHGGIVICDLALEK